VSSVPKRRNWLKVQEFKSNLTTFDKGENRTFFIFEFYDFVDPNTQLSKIKLIGGDGGDGTVKNQQTFFYELNSVEINKIIPIFSFSRRKSCLFS